MNFENTNRAIEPKNPPIPINNILYNCYLFYNQGEPPFAPTTFSYDKLEACPTHDLNFFLYELYKLYDLINKLIRALPFSSVLSAFYFNFTFSILNFAFSYQICTLTFSSIYILSPGLILNAL